jgi:hypothetical protein
MPSGSIEDNNTMVSRFNLFRNLIEMLLHTVFADAGHD